MKRNEQRVEVRKEQNALRMHSVECNRLHGDGGLFPFDAWFAAKVAEFFQQLRGRRDLPLLQGE